MKCPVCHNANCQEYTLSIHTVQDAPVYEYRCGQCTTYQIEEPARDYLSNGSTTAKQREQLSLTIRDMPKPHDIPYRISLHWLKRQLVHPTVQ